MSKKIFVVFGTRPEAIKMAPVVKELQKHQELKPVICVTAQHRAMLDQMLKIFRITPDYDLDLMQTEQTPNDITVRILQELTAILQKEKPDLVLVHGDTTTAMAAALAAFHMQIPIGHVEAGLRTYDKYSPFPEEINRQTIDSLADYLYTPTEASRECLRKKLNLNQQVVVTGNTAIDALKTTVSDDYRDPILDWVGQSRMILLTAHRRENLGEAMRNIFRAVRKILKEFPDVKLVYPVHANPKVRAVAEELLGDLENARLIEPLDVLGFHNLMNEAYYIVSDSGGVQEEAPSLGKPVLVIRNTTERPEGVKAGALKLVGTDEKKVYRNMKALLEDSAIYQKMACVSNPYGDGHASERIVKHIISEMSEETTMQYKIQSLIFPVCNEHENCRDLFYRGDNGILDSKSQSLTLGFAQHVDLLTYFNACSWQKWHKYTTAKSLSLHLSLKGKIRIKFLGAHKDALAVAKQTFLQKDFEYEDFEELVYTFPDNEEQMVGCEIIALSPEVIIKDGYYAAEVEKTSLNNVRLAIATTTCKKEDFVQKNVALIREQIINSADDIAENCFLHVVDNGRTLDKEAIESYHIKLHANENAGGAGGFARGMVEALKQEDASTHVLLMDDDVLVLPESIKRTYTLLRLLREEFKNHFISGAMLYYEDPATQHEDLGIVNDDGMLRPLKEEFDHTLLKDNLQNELEVPLPTNTYAAWWYCCIPVTQIKKNGLPLPIFIRIDDVEYSLRCKAQFITMNGLCVWHMGFATKFNGVFDRYQHFRNLLMIQAITNVIPDKDVLRLWYNAFRVELMQFNYKVAELLLKALEDFLRGPEYLMQVSGEELLQQNRDLDNTLLPIPDIQDGLTITMTPQEADQTKPLSLQNQIFLKLTWNGQRFALKRLIRPGIATVGYGGFPFQAEQIARREQVLAINPFTNTGVLYKKDRKNFKQIMKRYKSLLKQYKQNGASVRDEYAKNREVMVSEEFWRDYLKMGD